MLLPPPDLLQTIVSIDPEATNGAPTTQTTATMASDQNNKKKRLSLKPIELWAIVVIIIFLSQICMSLTVIYYQNSHPNETDQNRRNIDGWMVKFRNVSPWLVIWLLPILGILRGYFLYVIFLRTKRDTKLVCNKV